MSCTFFLRCAESVHSVLLGGECVKGKGGRGGINERLSREPNLGLNGPDPNTEEEVGEVAETSES